MMETRVKILRMLDRAPRALDATEIAGALADAFGRAPAIRALLADLAREGILERSLRLVMCPRGLSAREWDCYRPAGPGLPWPGEAPPVGPPPVPDDCTEEEEDLLAAAELVADEMRRLNRRPLAEALSWPIARVDRVRRGLFARGCWAYTWLFARSMPESEAAPRIAAVRAYKAAARGRPITMSEFDTLYGERLS